MVLKDAYNIAMPIWEALKPHCEITKIAGSIRRQRPEVKDIEIVCVPKEIEKPKDLFGGYQGMMRLPEFAKEVESFGTIVKGKPDGKYIQVDMEEPKINIDIFMTNLADFYRIFTIRTGSADWVAWHIAGGWKKLGWCGTDQGLRLQSECHGTTIAGNKKTWKCIVEKDKQTLPPAWKSEREFFDWLQIKWTVPERRNV